MFILKKILCSLICLYQYLISPLLGPRCRFHPTCSSYLHRCLQVFPIHIALWYGMKRIIKCHPFHSGGYDPVPCQKQCSGVFDHEDVLEKPD